MRVNLANMLKQAAARILSRSDDGAYAYSLDEFADLYMLRPTAQKAGG